MVSAILIVFLLVSVAPVWGGQPLQLCLKCHSAHYVDRGRCSECHRGNPASDRKNIGHAGLLAGKYVRFTVYNEVQMREAKLLLDKLACRRCHVSHGRGNRLAASLDGAAFTKTGGELSHSIQRPVVTMPNFGIGEAQITTLVNVILAGSRGRQADAVAPVRVHFNNSGKKSEDVFSKKCGGCHRAVSERLGAIGMGEAGANLSGLFSEYYPKTFNYGGVWTTRNLTTWLENPRKIRPWTSMQPVVITGMEMNELEKIFRVSSGSIK